MCVCDGVNRVYVECVKKGQVPHTPLGRLGLGMTIMLDYPRARR